jgi:hypothetical protein
LYQRLKKKEEKGREEERIWPPALEAKTTFQWYINSAFLATLSKVFFISTKTFCHASHDKYMSLGEKIVYTKKYELCIAMHQINNF